LGIFGGIKNVTLPDLSRIFKCNTLLRIKNKSKTMIKQFSFTLALAAVVFTTQAPLASAQSIVDIASGDANFSSLVAAVVSQDLAGTLAGPGTFTVFAPTDAAFAKLPAYVGDAIAKDSELLTDILLYHVAGEELFSGDVLALASIETLQGEEIKVMANNDGAFVNSSELTALDIDADNGVVHVIDEVLLPSTVYNAVLDNLLLEIQKLREMVGHLNG
jgi:uncharacterized surface protein with fasciclin (FAS1) repeats